MSKRKRTKGQTTINRKLRRNQEKFEDINVGNQNRKLKRDRQYNDETEKKTNNDGQNIAQKIKDGARPTPPKHQV
jgi:hypothetical protein